MTMLRRAGWLVTLLLSVVIPGRDALAQTCTSSTNFNGSIGVGDGSEWSPGFAVRATLDAPPPAHFSQDIYNGPPGTVTYQIQMGLPLGSYYFEGFGNTAATGAGPYYASGPTGSGECVDAGGCTQCTGGFGITLYSGEGAIAGTVLDADGFPANATAVYARGADLGGVPTCPPPSGYVAYTDGGLYSFRNETTSNNWGLQLLNQGGQGSRTYEVLACGLPGLDPTAESVSLTSNQLQTVDFAPTPDSTPQGPPDGPSCVGRPVNVLTGNVWFNQTDVVIPGRGAGLVFARNYKSRKARENVAGAFGRGWWHSYESKLTIPPTLPGYLSLRQGDGEVMSFRDANGNGTYQALHPATETSTIVKTGGTYTRQIRGGGSEAYDASGRLLSKTDPSGNATTLTYGGTGLLETVTEAGGRTLTLAYDSSERIVSLTGPEGPIATYEYDSFGLLQRVLYGDGTGHTFTYDINAQVLTVADASGVPVEAHAYDSDGRGLTSEIADGKEKYTLAYFPGYTTVTDALGEVTTYRWKGVKGIKKVTKIEGPCSSCGGGGANEREWLYDGLGRVLEERADVDGIAGLDDVRTYTYDPVTGDLLTETDAEGKTTTYTYDNQGRVLTVDRPDGGLTTYVQSPAGPTSITEKVTGTENRTTQIAYTQGKPQTVTDPRNKVTTLGYNGFGDLVSVTDPLGYPSIPGHITTFGYDALGRRTTVTDPLDKTTTTTYDARGRVTRITNPDTTHTDFAYDLGGRRTTVTDPLGRTTRYVYDDFGRLEAVVDPTGGTTKYGYDLMGNLTSLTDAEGRTTSFDYEDGRVTKVTYPGGAFESFTYDPAGRLETKTDRKNVVTTYTYDKVGRLKTKTYSGGTPPVTDPPVNYTYDAVGRLLTAANGTDTLTWTYDLAGQLLTEASVKNSSLVAYTYDDAGNRLTLSLDGQLFVTYAYDDASRLTTITRGSNPFGFGYDNAHRRTSLTYPNGVVTTYGYDDNSRLLTIDARKDATVVSSSVYTYDAAGNRLTKTHPEYSEAYTYDPLYRLTGAERPSGTPQRWLWSYDRVGNRLSEQIDDAVTTSSYNEKNQLLGRTAGGLMRWRGTLDEPGNVAFTAVTANGQPARMLPGNVFEALLDMQPGSNTVTVQATDVSGNQTSKNYQVEVAGSGATYTYDANGNLETKTEGADLWRYYWNAENQLVRVEKNATEVARFAYDPLGRRVEKLAAAANDYLYDGEDVLRTTASGSTRLFLHGPGIDEPLGSEAGGALTYVHADGLGSVAVTTTSAGSVMSSVRLDAWGVVEQGAPDVYAFTGREWDPETGLYYYRARYYDPRAGRFDSEDPIGFAAGVNFFSYAWNNPVTLKDPSGLDVYTCMVPSKGDPKSDSDTRYGPDVYGNPLHHDYICVVRPDGSSSCGGKRPVIPPTTPFDPVPSEPTNDPFVPARCDRLTQAPGTCFERCIERRIGKSNSRGPYKAIGANCQDWVNDQIWGCMSECFLKAAGK